MMEENLFVCVCVCRLVSCKSSSFTIFCKKERPKKLKERKKERKRVTTGLTVISQVQVMSAFCPEVP